MPLPARSRTAIVGLLTLSVLMLTVGFGTWQGGRDAVDVERLSEANWEQLVPAGKEVDAIYGDYVLQNRHLTAVVADPVATRNANMTTRDVAGALIDLAVRGSDGDQLGAFWPGRKVFPYRTAELPAPAAGPNGLPREGALQVSAEGSESRPAVVTTYALGAADHFLTVTSVYTNKSAQPIDVSLEDDFRADGQKEDMVRSPNGTADRFWLHDRYWGQAYGLDAPEHKLQLNSDARITKIVYENAAGQTKVTLAPGESYSLIRRVYPGRNTLDVQAVIAATTAKAVHPFGFSIRDGLGRPVANALIELRQGDSVYGWAKTDHQGTISTVMPAGSYTATISAFGRVLWDNRPLQLDSRKELTVIELADFQPGEIQAAITDAEGQAIPCKVELQPLDENAVLDFGPVTAEFALKNLCYTANGKFQQAVPAGRYRAIISRGPEYDAVFTELTVPPGKTAPLTAKLVRSVVTPGWVSSDFHSHSSPSGDNTGSQLGRVLNLVCEHIEFAPCTEHNRISTYQPHIARLGIQPFLASVEGMELTGTPLPLNHQNTFPLIRKPRMQDGGGPTTESDPEKQIEKIALWDDRSEKLIQQNHPDLGWLVYDRDGDGKPDADGPRTFPFTDVVEIHPIQNALTLDETMRGEGEKTFHNTIFRWLQMLNQGYRIYGVVNTDAHYNDHGSGWLRNWIQSSTDDPAAIKAMEMVKAAEQGRLVMSNGPYLEVTATAGGKQVVSGQDLAAVDGKVRLHIRVQTPNWHDVDRVFVLVNGRRVPEATFTRAERPDVFRSGALKFDQTVDLALKGDAHVIVVTGHKEGQLGPVMGPSEGKTPPAALTNPIFVDVDGAGFKPNGDTLDLPLPVKFVAKK